MGTPRGGGGFGTDRGVNSSGILPIGTSSARTCAISQLHVSSALLRPGAHVVRVALTKSNARVDVVAMPFPAGPAEVLFVVVVLIEDVDAAGLPLLARLFARLEELIFGEDEVARVPPHLWMAEREATESKQYAMRGEPALLVQAFVNASSGVHGGIYRPPAAQVSST